MKRINLTALPEVYQHAEALAEHLEQWGDSLPLETFPTLLDQTSEAVLRGAFDFVNASEGSIWLADEKEDYLVAVFNTGPQSHSLVGSRQPLGSGIISLVYANEQPYCENEIASSQTHDSTIDDQLGTQTQAMIAVPFYFAGRLRGVLSCVQIGDTSRGFDPEDIGKIVTTVSIIERLINERLLKAATGLDEN